MSKVLYIMANPKSEKDSYTFKMAESFIQSYKQKNPNDEVITLNLYEEGIKFLDEQMLEDMNAGKETVMLKYARQFASVDKYIIAAPMWNLGFPAILKAYFDYVAMVGVTFKYTAQGPIGLLANQGKKAIYIVSRGGKYSEGPAQSYEMGERYVRTIMGFMGVTDLTTISVELTNVLQGEALNDAVNTSIEQAKEIAQNF